MKIVFMGSPAFSVPALDALVEAGHEIVAVYCQPPRPSGRGQKLRPGPVHARAEDLGLTVYHPDSLRNPNEQQVFATHNADIAIVVAYGLILPPEILSTPLLGCLNIHASLLPRWRGAAPIHRAILAGDEKTGISIMQMDEGLDTGPVLLSAEILIEPQETTALLHDRLASLGAQTITQALDSLSELHPVSQAQTGVTYADKIQKAESRIDWTKTAIDVDRKIRGLSPFPGAKCEIAGESVKLLASSVVDAQGEPGKIIRNFTVACGEGCVDILRAQRPGKRAMDQDEFLRGFNLPEHIQ